MIESLTAWALGRLWQLVVAGVGVTLIVGSCAVRDSRLVEKGVKKESVRVETKAKQDVQSATAARDRSQSGSGGVRDKYARD